MSKKILGALGLVGACAACCAIPFAIPFLGAMVLSGATAFGMGLDTIVCAAVLLLAAGAVVVWYRRGLRAKATACAAPGACGAEAGKKCGQ